MSVKVNAMFQILGNFKDETALILLGSDETENNLNYKRIKVTHSLALPSWEMVQFVNDMKGTTVNGDWLDAVVVAMDVLKKETEYVNYYYCYYYYYYYLFVVFFFFCHHFFLLYCVLVCLFVIFCINADFIIDCRLLSQHIIEYRTEWKCVLTVVVKAVQ